MLYNWKDFLPLKHKFINFLKKVYTHEFKRNSFKRITTKILENKDFLKKSKCISEFILENEDFDFRQKPYLWIMRSYLENNFSEEIQPVYFYYIESYFKKNMDKIDEFYLIWSEIIWEDDPILDALQIYINYNILNSIWIKNFTVRINSTWIEKEKIKFKEELINFYDNKRNILSEESKELINTNPMLILKSENEDDKILNKNAPIFVKKFLKKESKDHYQKFKEYLELLEIPFIEDNSLVSSDENQTKSIYAFKTEDWLTIAKWHRHNTISKNLWENYEVPATWFWIYTNRIVDILIENKFEIKTQNEIDLFFVWLGDDAKKAILPISIKARNAWIKTVISLWTPSMKEQMLKAQKSGAKFIVMVGIMEAKNGIFQVRNQQDWSQYEIKKEELIDYIISKIWKEKLDFYCPLKEFAK